MSKTKIEWTEKSWNPFTGCEKISPGCDNCYAKPMANRFKGRNGYPLDDPFKPTFHPGRLDKPLSWKKGCKIFVCSMADLFHRDNSFEQIAAVFGVMASAPQHTFQVLTKRPERMQEFFEWLNKKTFKYFEYETRPQSQYYSCCEALRELLKNPDFNRESKNNPWPLPNLWLGVTAENQEQADKRIPILLQIPAVKRFVSIEPMLGAVDLAGLDLGELDSLNGVVAVDGRGRIEHPKLDWVIVGGENGYKARPMHIHWVRSIRDQCKEAGTPFFFKGWGEWIHSSQGYADNKTKAVHIWLGSFSAKVGKKSAGSCLDGVEYKEMPEDTITSR